VEIVIVGAGTFGASLAWTLARAGEQVTLVDQFEPGDARASSGGETRLYRCAHGPDTEYTEMARRARALWRELEDEAGEELLIECGMAWFAHREDGWEAASERTLTAQGIPTEHLDSSSAQLYPSFRGDDLAFVLLEPEGGVLRAERSVRALAAQALAHGARIVRGRVRPDGTGAVLEDSTRLEGDIVVWACGPWLAHLFGDLVSLRVTCQELLFIDGGPDWRQPGVPGWCDYDYARYGTADIDALGVKAAIDDEGPPIDPDAELPETAITEPEVAPTCASASPRSNTRRSSGRAPAAMSSRPIRNSSPHRILRIRTSGWSVAARVTASSTVRPWPSGSPPHSSRALPCRPGSPWANGRPRRACARRAPAP
jgi:glycine/D-amino acid oxidase-like deaminating enzyme